MRTLIGALTLGLAVSLPCGVGAQSLLDARITRFPFSIPFDPCSIQAFAGQLAIHEELRLGFETVPGVCPSGSGTPLVRKGDLTGLTIREALDRLIVAAPEYAWRVHDDVVVIRPVAAWSDPQHVLNREVAPFVASGFDMQRAILAIANALNSSGFSDGVARPLSMPGRGPDGSLPQVILKFAGGTVLDALNAWARVRRTHGWSLRSCTNQQTPDAQLMLSVHEPGNLIVRLHPMLDSAGASIHARADASGRHIPGRS